MAEGMATASDNVSPTTSPTVAGDKPGFSKAIQKRYSRTVEKMMQSFGRTDKTTDEDFDRLVETFTEHQRLASSLSSELKNYIKQARTLSVASASMQQAIKDAYDQKWIDALLFSESSEKIAEKWNSYMSRLEEAQTNLTLYVERFQELKQKVSKRSRKMTDYDSARHNLQSLENARKRDSFKVNKAQEEMANAKAVYESLNRDLHRELQELHESRVQRVCTYLSKLYTAEAEFLEETSKLKRQLAEAAHAAASIEVESRSRPASDFIYRYDGQPQSQNRNSNYNADVTNGPTPQRLDYDVVDPNTNYEVVETREASARTLGEKIVSQLSTRSASSVSSERNVDEMASVSRQAEGSLAAAGVVTNGSVEPPHFKASPVNARGPSTESIESSDSEGLRNSMPTAVEPRTGDDSYADSRQDRQTPYKVLAVYDYEACDADELSLKAGDVITIIEFDDPEEQDPGWLMGINESTGQRGIVPENFTKKL